MKLSQIQESAAMEMIEAGHADPDVGDRDTYMSGAYIRNLVKQLTTSSSSSSSVASSSSSSSSPPPTPPKNSQKSRTKAVAPHKKQVRRRLHTTRPYQERLLNMAEARKEIVTALKFHRASMKHQQHQQQQQQLQLGPPSPPPLQVGAKAELPSFYVAPPPPALLLPNQTLGLNLNLDAACLYTTNNNNSNNNNVARSPLPSPLSVLPDHGEIMTVVVDDRDQQGLGSEGSRAVGDQEMEEIKSIGEMHEMEWNDTVNLATSAWWFNFLHKTESEDEFDTSPCIDPHQFIEHAVEFPLSWEGGRDPISSLDANFELPCMKIEDIEGLDEEWLY